jgi:hypothetical protein
MRVLIHSTYPGTSARKALDLFLSPETPKRPADAKEIATFTYRDSAGIHVLFLYDVEDARLAAFLNAQNERSLYLESRVQDLRAEIHVGLSVQEALPLAARHLAPAPAAGSH